MTILNIGSFCPVTKCQRCAHPAEVAAKLRQQRLGEAGHVEEIGRRDVTLLTATNLTCHAMVKNVS